MSEIFCEPCKISPTSLPTYVTCGSLINSSKIVLPHIFFSVDVSKRKERIMKDFQKLKRNGKKNSG